MTSLKANFFKNVFFSENLMEDVNFLLDEAPTLGFASISAVALGYRENPGVRQNLSPSSVRIMDNIQTLETTIQTTIHE